MAVPCSAFISRLNGQEEFRFRSGVELINVTATVTDRSGRFVPGLRQTDFAVYEDDRQVDITHFSAERVPVSLGIVLDTSGSMAGDKIVNARAAIERFLDQLLNPDDEVFLYGFASEVELLQDWTTNREAVSAACGACGRPAARRCTTRSSRPCRGHQSGRNRKKAVVLISDGNDTDSRADIRDVRRLVRETEVLVYAVGIDGQGEPTVHVATADVPATRADSLPRPWTPAHAVADVAPVSARRQAAARIGSTSRPSGRSPTTAAAGQSRAQSARSRSGDRQHRRRTEPAVLSRLHQPWPSRRPLAHDPRGSARPLAARQSAARLHGDPVSAVRSTLQESSAAPSASQDDEAGRRGRSVRRPCDRDALCVLCRRRRGIESCRPRLKCHPLRHNASRGGPRCHGVLRGSGLHASCTLRPRPPRSIADTGSRAHYVARLGHKLANPVAGSPWNKQHNRTSAAVTATKAPGRRWCRR